MQKTAPGILTLLIVSWLAVGCTSNSSDDKADESNEVSDEDRVEEALLGFWSGTYFCNDIERTVTWSLTEDTDELVAVIEFSPIDPNDTLTTGSYNAEIEIDGLEVTTVPGEWIDQPEGIEAVARTGTVDIDAMFIEGTMDSPNCTTFSLEKDPAKEL